MSQYCAGIFVFKLSSDLKETPEFAQQGIAVFLSMTS